MFHIYTFSELSALVKSNVRGHYRHLESGKTVFVPAFSTRTVKKPQEQPGQLSLFGSPQEEPRSYKPPAKQGELFGRREVAAGVAPQPGQSKEAAEFLAAGREGRLPEKPKEIPAKPEENIPSWIKDLLKLAATTKDLRGAYPDKITITSGKEALGLRAGSFAVVETERGKSGKDRYAVVDLRASYDSPNRVIDETLFSGGSMNPQNALAVLQDLKAGEYLNRLTPNQLKQERFNYLSSKPAGSRKEMTEGLNSRPLRGGTGWETAEEIHRRGIPTERMKNLFHPDIIEYAEHLEKKANPDRGKKQEPGPVPKWGDYPEEEAERKYNLEKLQEEALEEKSQLEPKTEDAPVRSIVDPSRIKTAIRQTEEAWSKTSEPMPDKVKKDLDQLRQMLSQKEKRKVSKSLSSLPAGVRAHHPLHGPGKVLESGPNGCVFQTDSGVIHDHVPPSHLSKKTLSLFHAAFHGEEGA